MKVSILIAAMDGLGVTHACMESLRYSQFSLDDMEVCFVLSKSNDGTKEYIESIDWISCKLHYQRDRLFPSRAYNIAADMAVGEYYFVTNNDMSIRPDVIPCLTQILDEANPLVALACCASNYGCHHHGEDMLPRDIQILNHRHHFIFPFMIRASIWKEIGGFHQWFYNGFNCEELLMGRQIDMLSKLMVVDRRCFTYHDMCYTTARQPQEHAKHKEKYVRWMHDHELYRDDYRERHLLLPQTRQVIRDNIKFLNSIGIQDNMVDSVPR
jgi:GT2 family glycosyltransferase